MGNGIYFLFQILDSPTPEGIGAPVLERDI